MTDLEREILEWVEEASGQALDAGGRKRVEEALNNWLAFTARKKPSSDLPQKIETFRKRIRVLAENLTIKVSAGGYVVRAAGDGQDTLRMLERGTDWFDPAGNLTEMIVGAIFETA